MTHVFHRRAAALALLMAICLLVAGCSSRKQSAGPRLLLDGKEWSGDAFGDKSDLRVYVTCDGKPLAELPFGEDHTLQVLQDGVGENTVRITGDSVSMAHADCENQDCVNMGAVTRENLELRVMGGFIVCLPHKISVEVR